MDVVKIILVILIAVVASGGVSRLIPFAIPLPLIQILFGVLIAAVVDLGVNLQPETFFLLFLPPLLFVDGWRIPKDGLLKDKSMIIALALGLVVFTVLGGGLFIHWMIPTMPLAVAFALAAILSPTDPVAVSAIASRVPVPRRLMNILNGEALLNDASGLVCMRLAVVAALTGSFSLLEATGTFLWLVICGVSVGVIVTLCVSWLKSWWIARHLQEDRGAQVLISLLIPFAAYMVAEHLEGSGILAAVAAGITMAYVELSGQVMATTRVQRDAVWDMVEFTANGAVFVLLGEQLPRIIEGAAKLEQDTAILTPLTLFTYVVGIVVALAVLRLIWTWMLVRVGALRDRRRGGAPKKAGWRFVAVITLGGTRGTVTLAAALSLPVLLQDGSPFPARDLAIFLAACVIILSLIVTSVCVPMLVTGLKLPGETQSHRDEESARISAAQAAITAIEAFQRGIAENNKNAVIYVETGTRVTEMYRQRIEGHSSTGTNADHYRAAQAVELELRLVGLRAERTEVNRLGLSRSLSDRIARKLVKEVDMQEARMSSD